MYPNLYYAFKDLFGVEWPFLRFVNSFGFFVAISFILSAIVLGGGIKTKKQGGFIAANGNAGNGRTTCNSRRIITQFFIGLFIRV